MSKHLIEVVKIQPNNQRVPLVVGYYTIGDDTPIVLGKSMVLMPTIIVGNILTQGKMSCDTVDEGLKALKNYYRMVYKDVYNEEFRIKTYEINIVKDASEELIKEKVLEYLAFQWNKCSSEYDFDKFFETEIDSEYEHLLSEFH